ncbi:uncharacterized protein RCC_12137 [Ramularia collo-cygni]|uniref:N-acetyltransferase domain-containing protein n=1 Tax=Ramularia collo-cygni TaxID=112498 RepID=A0A2D3V236_9PEZI|nr:uncharacterized protein RCC_12137 [Ramularia collo-cygni]CZT21868.1 uncharacterized protein RCC_12137 [Ramularia collo-cygni]
MFIKTNRLHLRPINEEDLIAFHALQSNPEVSKWTSQDPSPNLEKSSARLDDLLISLNISPPSHPLIVLAITISPSPNLIGLVGTFRPREIGYSLLPEFWGKGYAQEACRGFCKRYLECYPGQQLFAKVDPRNGASVGCLRRCGFTIASVEEGRAEDFVGVLGEMETWLLRVL